MQRADCLAVDDNYLIYIFTLSLFQFHLLISIFIYSMFWVIRSKKGISDMTTFIFGDHVLSGPILWIFN